MTAMACLLSLAGCSESDKVPALTSTEASTLDALPFSETKLTSPKDGTNPLLCTITWTESLFYLNGDDQPSPAGPVSYTVQIDKAGNNFASAQPLVVTGSLSANVFVADMNDLLLTKFGAKADEAVSMEMRLLASYGENSTIPVVSSNTLSLTLTPYSPVVKIPAIYIVGDMNGWDNKNTDFMMFRDNNDPNSGVYTYTGRIGANCYFKFCPEESLGTYKMYCRNDDNTIVYEDRADGSFFSETDSYKTITLDIKNMTYTITEYDASAAPVWEKMNFVGSFCDFGSSNNDPDMVKSSYDPHIWSLSLPIDVVGYGVKFRANHSWDTKWCPITPTDNPYGISLYNNQVDNNIDISAQGVGNYYVKFNDLTGHYIVMLKK